MPRPVTGTAAFTLGARHREDLSGARSVRTCPAAERKLILDSGKQPSIPGKPCLTGQYTEQERLERLSLLAGVLAQRVPNLFRDVPDGDGNRHACMMPAYCRQSQMMTSGHDRAVVGDALSATTDRPAST
jgi:hypothetical protein